ncbi:uncharacterized protein LOC133338115 [Musca vetustissima]|uniref:uncharacterized protein LOC133338115 n=1 Tax=Musca vetustissima TaxID=27455 RepID=UPI002AB608A6|nr:uncharacterized protein LOC133338115 [Musca vetustissima]
MTTNANVPHNSLIALIPITVDDAEASLENHADLLLDLIVRRAVIVCFACLAFVSAVPIEEAIPQGIDGGAAAGSEPVNPADDQSFFLKLKLLKKLLFLG